MPSTRYQVFLSSTYTDLIDQRAALTQALLKMRPVIPAGMELFSADTRPPWEVITSILDDTDYLVLVIAGRYGSVDQEGISYTEREYDYAITHGIPVLAFVHAEPGALRADATESTEVGQRALAAFRAKVEDAHTIQRWRTADDLVHEVTRALHNAFGDQPRPGWVRGERTSATKSPVATQTPSGPRLRLDATSTDGQALQPVLANEDRITAYVQAAAEELLTKLPAEEATDSVDYNGWLRSAGQQQYGLGDILHRQNGLGAGGLSPFEKHHAEDRSEEEYRAEVQRYGEELGSALHQALDDVAAHVLVAFAPKITNLTERNYERVRIELHVEGDVRALEPADDDDPFDPLAHLPDPPRAWGPWTSSTLPGLPQVHYAAALSGPTRSSFASSVEIKNDGSTTLRYDAVHVRPEDSVTLDPVVLVVPEGTSRPLRATWRATATNIDGQARGQLKVPVEGHVVDLWAALDTTT